MRAAKNKNMRGEWGGEGKGVERGQGRGVTVSGEQREEGKGRGRGRGDAYVTPEAIFCRVACIEAMERKIQANLFG